LGLGRRKLIPSREQVTCSEPSVTPIVSAICSRLKPRSTRFLICWSRSGVNLIGRPLAAVSGTADPLASNIGTVPSCLAREIDRLWRPVAIAIAFEQLVGLAPDPARDLWASIRTSPAIAVMAITDHTALAATNKCLAQMNKTQAVGKATKGCSALQWAIKWNVERLNVYQMRTTMI